MSQKRLAFLVGLRSLKAISDFEHGRRLPTLQTAMLLEIVLSAKVSEIYVDLYHQLSLQAVAREAALLPPSDSHQIRGRVLGKD